MERSIEDILCLMIDELDQVTIERLGRNNNYTTCQNKYFSFAERLKNQMPEMSSLSLFVFRLLEMERREALLVGMKAGLGFSRMCNDDNGQDRFSLINKEITK